MRRSFLPFAAALGAVALVALSGTALAAGPPRDTFCDDATYPVPPGTYNNVIVLRGSTCTLADSTVRGNVIVGASASLQLFGSGSIGESLVIGKNSDAFEDSGWTVNGSTVGNSSRYVALDGTVHNVAFNNTQDVNVSAATIFGNFTSNKATDSVGIDQTTRISGNVVLNGASGGLAGFSNYYITSNTEIDGSVVVTDNQAVVDIEANHIKGNLTCYGNTPPPINIGNQVDGRSLGQCASPTAGASPAA